MKPATAERSLVSHGSTASASFGIDDEDQAGILVLLRDRLYTNKILAVLREYSANAWDEHRDAGKPDLPIKIVLPTEIEPTLSIRDYGRGLDEKSIFTVYIRYGKSLKRASNEVVGMLGIGAKSGFAYNDSFTITSWHAGTKSVYVAVIDPTNVGRVDKLHEEPCGNETGIEIKVPVVPKDIQAFQRESRRLFPYFEPTPLINLEIPKLALDRMRSGFLVTKQENALAQWIGVMGCVPYKIDCGALREELEAADLTYFTDRLKGGLYFDIGEVEVAGNREELEYTNDTLDHQDGVVRVGTKNAIVRKFALLAEDMGKEIEILLADPATSNWEKRFRVMEFSKNTGVPIPPNHRAYRETDTRVYDLSPKTDANGAPLPEIAGTRQLVNAPETFRLKKCDRVWTRRRGLKKLQLLGTDRVILDRGTSLIIKDNKAHYGGYVSTDREVFVVPTGIGSIDDIERELEQFLKAALLDGIPVFRASKLVYVPVSRNSGGPVDPKHLKRTFVLTGRDLGGPLSGNWEIVSRVPEDSDVFVILDKFQVSGTNFYYQVDCDTKLLRDLFSTEMPPIYGYKTTSRKHLTSAGIPGDPYLEWREEMFRDLEDAHPHLATWKEWSDWSRALNDTSTEKLKEAVAYLKGKLHWRHRISRYLHQWVTAVSSLHTLPAKTQSALHSYWRTMESRDKAEPAYVLARAKILEKYPLLTYSKGSFGFLQTLLQETSRDPWIDYIKLVDGKSP